MVIKPVGATFMVAQGCATTYFRCHRAPGPPLSVKCDSYHQVLSEFPSFCFSIHCQGDLEFNGISSEQWFCTTPYLRPVQAWGWHLGTCNVKRQPGVKPSSPAAFEPSVLARYWDMGSVECLKCQCQKSRQLQVYA